MLSRVSSTVLLPNRACHVVHLPRFQPRLQRSLRLFLFPALWPLNRDREQLWPCIMHFRPLLLSPFLLHCSELAPSAHHGNTANITKPALFLPPGRLCGHVTLWTAVAATCRQHCMTPAHHLKRMRGSSRDCLAGQTLLMRIATRLGWWPRPSARSRVWMQAKCQSPGLPGGLVLAGQ